MLRENNPRLSTGTLKQRIQRIICIAARAPNPIRRPGSSAAGAPPPPRSLAAKLREWAVALLRLRRLREWAELGREANAKVLAIDMQIAQLQHQLSQMAADTKAQIHAENEMKLRLSELRREVLFQQRRLSRFVMSTPCMPVPIENGRADDRLDALYLSFEDRFRGDREDIKSRLVPYVEHITTAGAGDPGHPIVDLGCGRGEWLELLREKNLSAYGVDGNSMMIERTKGLGLDARCEDLLQHVNGLDDMCRSAVTAFHVVEHLPLNVLIDLLDEALRILIPGGMLILETPNPETMRVGATTFYNDPTHRHPIPPLVLQFMVQHRGFTEVEVIKRHPFTQGLLEAPTADAELLNRVLFGPQDYAVIARRS